MMALAHAVLSRVEAPARVSPCGLWTQDRSAVCGVNLGPKHSARRRGVLSRVVCGERLRANEMFVRMLIWEVEVTCGRCFSLGECLELS